MIFSDVDTLSVVSDAIQVLTPQLGYCIESFRSPLISLILSAQQIQAGKKSRLYASLGSKRLRTSERKVSGVIRVVGIVCNIVGKIYSRFTKFCK